MFPMFADSEWSKDETDYLFNIVHEYDLRWYVIHDRYDFPGGPARAIEVRSYGIFRYLWGMNRQKDLKDRYYSCCRKLIRSRPCSGDDVSKSQLLNGYQFDKG